MMMMMGIDGSRLGEPPCAAPFFLLLQVDERALEGLQAPQPRSDFSQPHVRMREQPRGCSHEEPFAP